MMKKLDEKAIKKGAKIIGEIENNIKELKHTIWLVKRGICRIMGEYNIKRFEDSDHTLYIDMPNGLRITKLEARLKQNPRLAVPK